MFRHKNKWRVQWTVKGKRLSRLFGSQADARRFELELELGIAQAPVKSERLTFRAFAERWLEDHVKVEKAKSQWTKDEARIRLHLNPAFGDLPLDALRQSHLLSLKSELLRKKAHGKKHLLGRKTANLVLAQAKHMAQAAVARELIPSNPWAGVKLYRLSELDFQFWRPDERDTFAAKAAGLDPAFTRLVVFACHTGMRKGEIAALTRRDLDFDRGRIRIRGSFDFENDCLKSTKGGEVGEVPINATLRAALEPCRFIKQPDALVFDRVLFTEACARLKNLADKVGVTPIRFHDLRHTFASGLAMGGLDLLVIQKLLRHKSYQMTLRYAHLHPDHLDGATDVLCTQAAHELSENRKTGGPRGT